MSSARVESSRLGGGIDEEAVVIEIGSLYTKCGYSREALPRSIIRNPESLISLTHESSKEDYYPILRDFLQIIYLHKVQKSPKDSATILCEGLMAPRGLIEATVKILLEDLQVPILYIIMSNSLPLYTTGSYTGLLIDAGYFGVDILPIYEGIPIINSFVSADCGGKALLSSYKNILEASNPGHRFSLETVEDIVARLSIIPYGKLRKELQERPTANKIYNFIPLKHNRAISVDFKQRLIPESIFFGEYSQDSSNIAASILRSLQTCDIDTRKQLINSIIVSGGCAMMIGFMERLEEELLDLLHNEPDFSNIKPLADYVQINQTPYPRNLLTWIGASIFGSLPGLDRFSLNLETYQQKGLEDKLGRYYLFGDRPSLQEIYQTQNLPMERMRLSFIRL
ncbi:ACTR10 [Blepharisma stoltei]|uniref:Actin-related protein 10 n=1 Tax=Blepharisma stoltei TaxID=1481888 RepID=A0AAU9JJJ9_9CILI|nr:unnamed protein product [Blepharisma stoltei]